MLASSSILAALAARGRSGRGQHLEVSLYRNKFIHARQRRRQLSRRRTRKRALRQRPSEHVPYTTYPTADGMIAVAVGNDAQFAKFAHAIGRAEWAGDARFKTEQRSCREPRSARRHDRRHYEDRCRERVDRKAERGRIPCGRINSVKQAFDDPQTAARRMIETVEHPALGPLKGDRHAVQV